MKEKINILFSCDSGYAIALTVCVTSVFENNKNSNVSIYILHSSLSDDQKDKLIQLARSYDQHIELIKIHENYFNNVPTLRWSKEAYYRLLVNDVLPNNIDRIIYLDCDIVVNKSLKGLYLLDLDQNHLAALPEEHNSIFRDKLGLNPNGLYFQSGVILFDVEKSKELLNYQNALNIIKNIGANLIAVDQDVINVMFDGKIKPLDKIYNDCDVTNFHNNNWNRLRNYVDPNNINSTVVFHYSAGKPWNNLFSGSCEKIWYKYLILSPYSYLYTNKYNTLKYKILRTGIFKLIFYKYIHLTPVIDNTFKKIFSQRVYNKIKNIYRRRIK